MKKISIIGSCGAGKSTFAKKLSEKLNLPLISLDTCYWKPGWVRTPRDEWRPKVKELVNRDEWVMEGNYQNTFDIKFPASDVIIVLDINRFVCFWRIWKRRILKNRADKLDFCEEQITFRLMWWVLWDYSKIGKREIKKYIAKYKDKKIIILKTNKDIKNFFLKIIR